MSRLHNFSAGPAVLPASVITELQDALPEFKGTGQGLMELSHRSAAFQAVIDCTARIRVLGHRIVNSSCDDDTVAGFPELPGFLDEGESADIVLQLANDMPVDLSGGVLVTTDRPDLFTVLPVVNPLPLELPAAAGATPGRQDITIRAVAVDDFMGAASATVQLSILAQGFDAAELYELPIELERDGSKVIFNYRREVWK